MTMRTTVVTGASGFCGRATTSLLEQRGDKVICVNRADFTDTSRNDKNRAGRLATMMTGQQIDCVYHFAGSATQPETGTLYDSNLSPALTLLECVRDLNQLPVIVIVGSAAEYGPVKTAHLPVTEAFPELPVTEYGKSKLAQTRVARLAAQAGIPVIISRPFNIIGAGMPRHLVLGSFLHQIAHALPAGKCLLSVRDITPSRDFLFIEDAVQAWLRLSLNPAAYGSTVNICTGVPTTVSAIIDMIIKASPIPIEIRIEGSQLPVTDSPVHFGDPRRLRQLTGLVPRPITDTIIKSIVTKHLAEAQVCTERHVKCPP